MHVRVLLIILSISYVFLKFRAKLGPLEILCNITYLVQAICYSVKFLDYVCDLVDFVSDAIVGVVKKSINGGLKMATDVI